MPIEGRCHCGACHYRIELDRLDDVANCHCSICRRSTGGTYVTWATVPEKAFSWRSAEPRAYAATVGSIRWFCPDCGAQLALWTERSPDTMDVTVSTLDDPDVRPPDRHIFVANKLAWVSVDDGLPCEEEEIYPDPSA